MSSARSITAHLELLLEVGALDRTQLLVENDQRGVLVGQHDAQLLDLAFADERGGVG